MKKKIAILSAVLLAPVGFLALAQETPVGSPPWGGPAFQAWSDGERGHRGFRGRGGSPGAPLRMLGLDEDQRAQLKTLREELRGDMQPLREQGRALREMLRAELDAGTPDATVVGGLVIDLHDLRQTRRARREAFRESFISILTPEQLDRLEEFRQRREERRRFRRGPDHPEAGDF